jgi:excisionase family DNA binding protein
MSTSPTSDTISTGQAAELLGVGRDKVLKLVKAGAIGYTLAGSHRRLSRADVEKLAGVLPVDQRWQTRRAKQGGQAAS